MKEKGFTLIELMIIVAIVSMIGVFGVGSVRTHIKKMEANKIYERVPVLIESYIEKAFQKGSKYTFTLNTNGIEISNGTGVVDSLNFSIEFTYSGRDFEIDEQGGIDADSKIIIKNEGNPYLKIEIKNIASAINYADLRRFRPNASIENLEDSSYTDAEKEIMLANDANWTEVTE